MTPKQELREDLAKIIEGVFPTGWALWKMGIDKKVEGMVESLALAIEKYIDSRLEEQK